ncbi:MAG: branched-chain amino acid ABC transporter permease [Lachnospiraceae bacterium]|nr:branched-chain amino acid ABC transporter permease [Lachnospiraceae bacterium]
MKKYLTTQDAASRNDFMTYGMVLAAFIIVQILSATGLLNSQMKGLLVPLCIYSIMAISLNLVVGILGELSIGHAGFMCVGAFAAAFFSKCTDGAMPDILRFIIAIIIGGIVAGIFGFLIGIPVLRLNGDYLAIVTLAFGEIIKNVINVLYIGRDANGFHISASSANNLGLDAATGEIIVNGPQGITGTPKDSTFLIAMIVLIICLVVVLNLIHSRDGRAIMAIRDNHIAAESVGIHLTKYKLTAFTISAVIAGFAGALYAHNLASLIATPARFGYNMSIMFLVFVVLGGIGSTRGAIIAAVILTLIPEVLRFLANYRMLIYSIVLIVIMLINWSQRSRAWMEQHKLGRFIYKKKSKAKEGGA